jgi:hypothetical protein
MKLKEYKELDYIYLLRPVKMPDAGNTTGNVFFLNKQPEKDGVDELIKLALNR